MGKIIDNATDMYVPRTGYVYPRCLVHTVHIHAAAIRPYVEGDGVVCARLCARGYARATEMAGGEGGEKGGWRRWRGGRVST